MIALPVSGSAASPAHRLAPTPMIARPGLPVSWELESMQTTYVAGSWSPQLSTAMSCVEARTLSVPKPTVIVARLTSSLVQTTLRVNITAEIQYWDTTTQVLRRPSVVEYTESTSGAKKTLNAGAQPDRPARITVPHHHHREQRDVMWVSHLCGSGRCVGF